MFGFTSCAENSGEQQKTERFHSGFKHCVVEVSRYAHALEPRLRETLMTHLQARLINLSTHGRPGNCSDAEPVSSTNGGASERALRFDYGYETSSPTDASDDSSDGGDGSVDAEVYVNVSHQEEPEDYRLHRGTRHPQDNPNEPMWRPW